MPVAKFTISMDPGLAKRVRSLAKREGLSVSAVIASCVARSIGDEAERRRLARDPLVEELARAFTDPAVLERAARVVAAEVDNPTLFREAMRIAGERKR